MTFAAIAAALDLPENTVRDAYKRGMRKLWERNDCGITIPTIYACAEDCHPELRAGSAECDREFVLRYGGSRGSSDLGCGSN